MGSQSEPGRKFCGECGTKGSCNGRHLLAGLQAGIVVALEAASAIGESAKVEQLLAALVESVLPGTRPP